MPGILVAASRIERGLAGLSGIIVVLMAFFLFADAAGRYLFSSPISGMSDLVSLYLMVSIVWLAAPWTQRVGGNIAVDVFSERLPSSVMAVVDRVNCMLAACVTGMLAYTGYEVAFDNVGRSILGGFYLATAPPHFIFSFGATLLTARLLLEGLLGKSVADRTSGGHSVGDIDL